MTGIPLPGYSIDEDREWSALWSVAEFPRVPIDAPKELRDLVVDVSDPKRIYTIHRAHRRHQIHGLVERFIAQVRFGCQNKHCNVPTCFSCRKRVANGVPVRRYNSTSARSLAVFLATQDDPEHNLCPSPSAAKPITVSKKISVRQTRAVEEVQGASESIPSKGLGGHVPAPDEPMSSNSNLETLPSQAMEKPARMDHRSFIQNVINTIAFKMVEWVTPQQFLTDPGTSNANQNTLPDYLEPPEAPTMQTVCKGIVVDGVENQPNPDEENGPKPEQEACETKKGRSLSDTSLQAPSAEPVEPTVRRRSSSSKRAMLGTNVSMDASPDLLHLSRDRLPPELVRKLSSQRSPLNNVRPTAPPFSPEAYTMPTPTIQAKTHDSGTKISSQTNKPVQVIQSEMHQQPNTAKPPKLKTIENAFDQPGQPRLPQSLSHMTFEAIQFICDIQDDDWNSEVFSHSFYPPAVFNVDFHPWTRRSLHNTPSGYPASLRRQWRMFCEQAIFDVIRNPVKLLKTFTHPHQRSWCSGEVRYAMLRLTRAAPSLVLEALWGAMETVYLPPDEVIYKSDASRRCTPVGEALPDNKAVFIINICFHALVAVVPLLPEGVTLEVMRRVCLVRAKGLVYDQSIEDDWPSLCARYEDAFTNVLALRLARRVFTAIPTRQAFAESRKTLRQYDGRAAPGEDILAMIRLFQTSQPNIPHGVESSEGSLTMVPVEVTYLVIQWARTVLMNEWDGSSEVPKNGPVGGALAMIDALYKQRDMPVKRSFFETPFMTDRLNSVEMPSEWFRFEPNRKTTHLLDYPYLFNATFLVTFFRSINYFRMNEAYETAKAKKGFMQWTTKDGNLINDAKVMVRLERGLHLATMEFLVLRIRRDNILADAFDSLWHREKRELLKPLKVRIHENGVDGHGHNLEAQDDGGVQQEFFRLAMAEALNPDSGLFTQNTRTKMSWFKPNSPEPLWRFELIGMLVSLAVYNGLTLPVTFPKALYRKLLGVDVSQPKDIEDGWPEFAAGFGHIRQWDESEGSVEDIFGLNYEFSADNFGKQITRWMRSHISASHFDHENDVPPPAWPQFGTPHASVIYNDDAPPVTGENRESYIKDYIYYLTDISIRPQFEAFEQGFYSVVGRRSINVLVDAGTLQSIIEGVQSISVVDWRRITQYDGYTNSCSTINDFWNIVSSYSDAKKKKLLQFVTASERVPVGGMTEGGFTFVIQKNGVNDESLPSSSTCYGILLLPVYNSMGKMREKLDLALENTEGFGMP
ncbi:HECT-domain-containing protein-like protein [Calycina marina]|uniref:HECT-type E3 ubiquitin transferase n=1 Tax=Calycina marina TaxID=1763456 RepID=A0A9P7Z7Q1_9HELO|nr:HECT-domain-containing protein-like protein [Calycina marina]